VSIVTSIETNVSLPDSLFLRQTMSKGDALLPLGADSVIVPFELWRNHIYIKVRVNGKGPFAWIFDSGAGGIAISKRLLPELGLVRLGATEARGVGGADSSDVFRVDSLEVAAIQLTELMASSMDLGPLEKAAEQTIDGIIGYDLLSRFIISVDYARHQLTIFAPDSHPRSDWGAPCPLSIDLRLPYVDAVVSDSIPCRLRLDTGSASTIDFHAPFVAAHGLLKADSTARPMTATGVGGSVAGYVGQSPVVSMCGNRIDSLQVGFSSALTGVFAGANTAGNVGAGVLKAFLVTFDYGREKVYFQRNRDRQAAERVGNMAGVELRQEQGRIAIGSVVPGGAGDGFLQPGDVILEIDRESVRGKALAEVNAMLTGNRGLPLEIRVRRGARELSLQILLDSLY
jgi:hypothetical protein